MKEEINIRRTMEKTVSAVESRHRAMKSAARRGCKAERPRPRLNRHNSRESLLVEMLPLVKRIAFNIRKHLPAHVEVDELVANGVLGLVDAVAKFDPSKRVKLEAYARHRVRGAILDGLRRADTASRDLRQKNKRIQTLYRKLESKLGRPVQDEEMTKALGMQIGEWNRALTEVQSVGFDCGSRVLTASPTLQRRSTDPELLTDGCDDPFDLCYRREQHEILDHALSRLPDREREIITLHNQHGLTMKQIALRMHVDASRISQIHSAALGRLKASVDSVLNPGHAQVSEPLALSMAAGAGA